MTASVREREVQTVSQERKRRTRSRTISHLGPIVVSQLPAHEYDLDPACISLVCPSCRTWVPIRVADTERATAKLVPHHTEQAGTEDPVRCRLGSHRLVTIDVSVAKWSRRLEQGVAETNGRRADRVIRKPQPMPTPAVMQIVGGLVDDKTVRELDEAHVRGCSTCSIKDDKGTILRVADLTSRCTDGRRFAQLAAHTKRLGPARRKAQMDREDWNDRRAWGLRLLHEQQWQNVSEMVADTELRRVRDTLAALIQTLNPHKADAPQLTEGERAGLMNAITLLATQEEQLTR
ncbi:hypothetical protein [Streptomyces sp. NPDC093109]|uniref:hypothetical protein n=1 Tax=Streptomyces sp. NPDC093109 TaxID=3154977 RepID=UPI00344C1426